LLLEKLVGHPFDLKFFITAEDVETYRKNEKLYDELYSQGIISDVREFKHKNFMCKCKLEGRQKV